MDRRRVSKLVALLLVLVVAPSLAATSWIEDYVAVGTRANTTCQSGPLEECRTGLRRLAELTDGRPDFSCRLARVEAKLGDAPAALEDLSLCIRAGLVFKDLETDPALAKVRALRGFAAVRHEAERHAAPAAGFARHLALKDPGLIAEDVAYDAEQHAFLISSVRERKIVRLGADGAVEDFITTAQAPMWGVYALAIDARRGLLWATTSASAESPPFDPKDDGASAVLEFDLRTRTLLGRFERLDGHKHGFGDVTLAPNGDLIVADGIEGGLYRVEPGTHSGLKTLLPPGAMRSPQTPAILSGTDRVLIPDYTRGIAVMDFRRGGVEWLTHPAELALFGIDGLYVDGRRLIAIQNGTVPERVLVMDLDASCTRIVGWRAVVAQVPGLGDPTHGTLVDGNFYFIANSGWDRVKEDGSLPADPGAPAAELWTLNPPATTATPAPSCPQAGG